MCCSVKQSLPFRFFFFFYIYIYTYIFHHYFHHLIVDFAPTMAVVPHGCAEESGRHGYLTWGANRVAWAAGLRGLLSKSAQQQRTD